MDDLPGSSLGGNPKSEMGMPVGHIVGSLDLNLVDEFGWGPPFISHNALHSCFGKSMAPLARDARVLAPDYWQRNAVSSRVVGTMPELEIIIMVFAFL